MILSALLWILRLPLRQLRQFNNYELTMMTLKGGTFAGFKIQRSSVFYFVIDVASVILKVHWFTETVYEVSSSR